MQDLLSRNNYAWPSKYPAPFDHQRVTAEFLIRNKRAFCLNGIGSGKSLSLLWAADFLMTHGKIKKVLISAPLSTLWSVWSDEIWQNLFHRKSVVLHGSKEKRKKLLKTDVDFYIINHDGISTIFSALKKRKDIGLVIVDEGAELRNGQTRKWKMHNWFAGPDTSRGMWWVTGSPMPKGPEDIWAQAKIINPTLVPKYFTRFRDTMMRQVNMYKWQPIDGWENKCFAMLQPSIRFSREECIDLPDCTTQSRKVNMSTEQSKAYKEMLQDMVVDLKGGQISALNEAAKRIKLMQLAAGAVYDGAEKVHFLNCQPKLKALRESIRAAGNKAIVFVSFRHSIKLLYKYLLDMDLTVGVVYGDVNVSTRREIFNAFQNQDLNIILAHPGTMAHGLTLTASHTIIWWAPCDSYRTYEQACGRISRPGQKCKQTIIHLTCSDIEEKIYRRLKKKEKMQGILLEILEEK